MSTSTPRHGLLQAALADLAEAMKRLPADDWPDAFAAVGQSARRLRDLLPLLRIQVGPAARMGRRLRKLARRFTKVRRVDAHLATLDLLGDRGVRQATTRLKNDLHRRQTNAALVAVRKSAMGDYRRIARAGERLVEELRVAGDSASAARDLQWALRARTTRRALAFKEAIEAAGAVYVPGRLDDTRRAARRLRLGMELLTVVNGSVTRAHDTAAIVGLHDLLEELRDSERLIARARDVQSAISPPDVRAWREMDALIALLENRCRRLHARYVRQRAAALSAGARLAAARPAPGASRRKAG